MKRASAPHRLGPQRNPDIDTAVLSATRQLLVENGYAATTIDAIAKRAGVGRPAVYRRWPSKAHIVHAAVYPAVVSEPQSSGRVDEDVSRLMAGALVLFGDAATREAVPGLMGEVRTDSVLRAALVTEQIAGVRDGLREVLEANDRVLREGVDADALLDLIAGAAIFARCVRDQDDGSALAQALTSILLHGIMR